ncbi:biotin-dependent carboxyltransferase family protein [Cupriavidus taiwanensis]|uniref:Carboxyltransferase domain-containing protein n=1 Tax=Cupriavidus taiwanensis TaxID=164546 RepID=A0A7Z7JGK1_9BURK|nr:biotin-dependent carboxyltransferase family protein [Cupriavidus taiwanensis]SOZ19518.1 conserved hypothetical protein [Cupriavidus taiwanensis]SOZ97294.1 conserved hypothetical protein [Cupriavidus taiwanensis]SPC26183.1 conserved hypothetical protein [Cupriavidus taiwanensis]SPD37685.1 conserved protein of unknown function [Cupriavidus taiwanensis]
MIEISSNGALNLVVDSGRIDAMTMGVSLGGPMDKLAFDLGNCMVGNEAGAAGIEVTMFPFRAQFDADVLIAVTGASGAVRIGEKRVPPYWCHWVRAGETLVLEPPTRGVRTYIAVAGGIAVPEALGSRSTDIRAGFGGVEGRGLKRGDKLEIGAVQSRARRRPSTGSGFGVAPEMVKELFAQLSEGCVPLRCIAAAEYERFTDAALEQFAQTEYTVQPESNRMGYRLAGAKLELRKPLELFSHGIVSGTVQVPPSGQPIIQLADANTCGGYPKIANVIECDLWRLGQVRPGTRLRFEMLQVDAALEAVRQHQKAQDALAKNVELIAGRI